MLLQELYEVSARSIEEFLRDKADSAKSLDIEPYVTAASSEKSSNIKHVHDPAGPTIKANFEMFQKLPGRWGTWTGNVSRGPEAGAREENAIQFDGELIKVSFKTAVWQKYNKNNDNSVAKLRTGSEDEDVEESIAHLSLNRADSVKSSAIFPGFSGSVMQSTTTTTAGMAASKAAPTQVAFGAVRYRDTPADPYWAALTLTECLIALPFYQHLSSEKFRVLEHFALLRSFRDGESILTFRQSFYGLFIVR